MLAFLLCAGLLLSAPAAGRQAFAEDTPLVPEKTEAVAAPEGFALIPAGPFNMGSAEGAPEAAADEKPEHEVYLTDFYMGIFEVTFEEYDSFCLKTGRQRPEDERWGRGRRPVINVSWYDAADYCNWKSSREGLQKCYDKNRICDITKKGYRLPTEAEWEKAARGSAGQEAVFMRGQGPLKRGGRGGSFHEGGMPPKLRGNFDSEGTKEAGSYPPNGNGLYDTAGNVFEWCGDWYGADYYGTPKKWKKPSGPGTGKYRAARGGAWSVCGKSVTTTTRVKYPPDKSYTDLGFRCARTK